MRRTTVLLASMLLATAAQARSPAVSVHTVSVPLDQVRMMAFSKPISTLYVGNPVIADVTMIDKRHAFIQGKAFGATNIVALDSSGTEISNQEVVVFGSAAAVVTLQRGTSQTTYSCVSSRCDPSPLPGDGKDLFDQSVDQIVKHQALISKIASGGL